MVRFKGGARDTADELRRLADVSDLAKDTKNAATFRHAAPTPRPEEEVEEPKE